MIAPPEPRLPARIGVLGGTFDPIHCGHVSAAIAARDALGLAPVLVIPSRLPPHRPVHPRASAFHRFAMAALAVSGEHDLMVSDDELSAEGPSYTASTLELLHSRAWTASQIFFITGADAFAEIATWKRYPEVLELANFVVVSRPGHRIEQLRQRLPELASRMRPAADAGDTAGKPFIYLLQAPTPDVSSTTIRERLRQREPITGLVPPLVELHIVQHRLYTAEQLHGQI